MQRSNKPIDPYYEDWLEIVDTAWDYRDDPVERGVLSECFYCKTVILHDGDGDDFDTPIPESHCTHCTTEATRYLCG